MYRIIFVFFFLSGFSSLVFEVVWERMLQQVFGTTSFALSTLLTAFMGGLALGSWLAGKYADRLERPLRVYGLLEGAIGLYALVVPVALDFLPTIYGAFFDFYLNDFYLFSLLRFAAAFAILIVPTTMMGATLPIVSRWVSRRKRLFQGSIGFLYGVNTFGACAGTLLAGFSLLPTLGLSATNTTFAAVNFALCALVVGIDFAFHEDLEPDETFGEPSRSDVPDDESEESSESDQTADDEEETPFDDFGYAPSITEQSEPLPRWLAGFVLVAFAVSGAISMSYQVLWTRAYVIILGSSTYSFTLILAAFLIGIAAGSSVVSPLVKRIRRPVFWLALSQLGVAAFAIVAFFALDNLPTWLFHRFREQIGSVAEVYFYYFFLVGVVVLIPTFLQGMSFPLVIRSVVQSRKASGEQVGNAYAYNTAGSIVGSFVAGFILLVTLGLYDAMSVVIGVNILLAVTLAALELREKFSYRRTGAFAVVTVVTTAAFFLAPSVDRIDLTRGMFRVSWARELFTVDKLREDRPELVFYEDGLTATVSVERRDDMHTLKANGKPEASDGSDMATQILVGLLPYVARAGFDDVSAGDEKSAMIGFGSGVTAGSALQWPLESLDVIEIESAMIEASKFFAHVNNEPLEDDRLRVVESDGRNFLEYTDHTYDVIVSEPSNPWIAGVSSLFTVDHFEHVKRHLAEDGVFAQWVQLYEMRPENVKTILNTVREVFPHVHGFTSQAKGTDMMLVASKRPLPFPAEGWDEAWEIDSAREELKRAGISDIYELYGLAFITQRELDAFAEGAPLNTDDNGLLEFEAPKDLIRYKEATTFFADDYYEQAIYGDLRPYLEDWPDDAVWTAERVGRLARAEWLAGKDDFAMQLREEAGYAWFESIPKPFSKPFGPLERVHLVQHARRLHLGEALVQTWPRKESEYHKLLAEAVLEDKHTQTGQYLEGEREPGEDGYGGERGLLYAYILLEGKYYAFAERQIEHLAAENDPEIVESLPYALLRGSIKWQLREYKDSWEAYLRAGAALLR